MALRCASYSCIVVPSWRTSLPPWHPWAGSLLPFHAWPGYRRGGGAASGPHTGHDGGGQRHTGGLAPGMVERADVSRFLFAPDDVVVVVDRTASWRTWPSISTGSPWWASTRIRHATREWFRRTRRVRTPTSCAGRSLVPPPLSRSAPAAGQVG